VSRLTLLLPALSRFAGQALPDALGKALARADRTQADAGEAAQLLRHLRPLPARWPQAALTRLLDTGEDDARAAQWLRADPAHIRPDINGARLLGIGRNLGIEQADVDALLPALRPLFGDAGFVLDAPHPQRWYLRLPRGSTVPEFASPDTALGDDVFQHRAEGVDARRWRVLESEVQIVLHNHPHNAARLEQGRVPINTLWFWSAGVLPDSLASDSVTVFSDDPVVQGAARLGKIACMPLADFQRDMPDALIDLRHQRDVRSLLQDWMLPACTADAQFDFADGASFTLIRGQRWRFWRRPLARLTA
jgi:hypothetical protein